MKIKSISKKQIGLIGGIFGFILLIAVLGGGDSENSQTFEQKDQQTQNSLNQSVQNILTPEENIGDDNNDNLELEQNEKPTENIEEQELFFKS